MPARRKVASLLALAVLSVLHERPMHRYEMAAVIRARGKDEDMGVKLGSLYTVVENLAKHGFLEVVGQSREGGRPERTVYRITDAGREEMLDWTRELLATPSPEQPSFAAGLSVLGALPPAEVIALLRHRLGLLDESVTRRREALEANGADVPRLFLVEDEYKLAITSAEADWTRSLLEELTSGTHPSLPGWQAWHAAGAGGSG